MKLALLDLTADFDRVKDIWCSLSADSNHSYFLSWGWIENWIRCLPENIPVKLAVYSEHGLPILAFFLGHAKVVRRGVIHSRSLFLNSTGIPLFDQLYIEYNSMLHTGIVKYSLQEVLECLPKDWDEFVMPGLDSNAFPGSLTNRAMQVGNISVQKEIPSPYVDLDLVRQTHGDYVSLLSRNTRSIIRRSYRGYETRGPVVCEVANDEKSALNIFDELVRLHQRAWQARGTKGAFASDFFGNFHRRLILQRFKHGEIQLLRTCAGDVVIGCLYNFVFNRKVYFYQSGINYETDKRLKPGFICHVEAVRHNVAAGHACYDFLGGDSPYKKKLSTHQAKLIWAKVQKPRMKYRLETRLRTIKKTVQSLLHKSKVTVFLNRLQQ